MIVRLAPAVLLATLLVVAGCGDDDDDDRPSAQGLTTTTAAPEAACELTTEAVDQGASVDILGVFCDGDRLQLDGQPTAFSVGGTVTHADGLRCEGERLTVLSATSDDGRSYDATAVTYRPDGTDLVEVDREQSTIDATTDAELLDPYYRSDCSS